jgi:hypothetical protein
MKAKIEQKASREGGEDVDTTVLRRASSLNVGFTGNKAVHPL